jgi:polyisoprenyl-teichoic acid--peptidoglycan teichoic acid transferase
MLILIAIFGLLAVLVYIIYDRTVGATLGEVTRTNDVRTEKPQGDGPPPPLLQAPFNVLLIGVDKRDAEPEEGARSDTLIVVHVDPLAKWASMLSIPRDTYVTIPKSGEGDKINGAYSYGYRNPEIYGKNVTPDEGGAALAAETVEEFLGITIDYTAQVDFNGFQKLVDAIDGITIDVPYAILDAEYPTEDFGYMRLLIEPGLQRMDGLTALRYARTRHVDSDFGRGARQQQVIQAALNEVKRRGLLGNLEALPELLAVVRESIKTTMPIDDLSTLRSLAALAQEMGTDRIQRFTLNPDTVALDPNFDNRFDIHWDPASVRELAQQFEQMPGQATATPEEAVVQVQNGKGIKGLAGQISLDLELAGYTLAEPADAPSAENPNTLILDYSGRPQTRERLAEYFNLDPEYVRDETDNQAAAPYGVDIVVRIGQDYEPRLETQGNAVEQ